MRCLHVGADTQSDQPGVADGAVQIAGPEKSSTKKHANLHSHKINVQALAKEQILGLAAAQKVPLSAEQFKAVWDQVRAGAHHSAPIAAVGTRKKVRNAMRCLAE